MIAPTRWTAWIGALLIAGAASTLAHGQWINDGNPLCVGAQYKYSPQIVSDGAGGAIVVWDDRRNGYGSIYAQRITGTGVIPTGWPSNGTALYVATRATYARKPVALADGSGGLIVAWQDFRHDDYGDIYAHRITSAGAVDPAWPIGGIPVCVVLGRNNTDPRITTDGSGGAIFTWYDFRLSSPDIYAQRVTAAGSVAIGWPTNGVLVAANGNEREATLCSDGSQGAILVWSAFRSSSTGYNIYARRVTATGAVQWTPDGFAICAEVGDQTLPEIMSDGQGGAFIVWTDSRSANTDIYLQRVTSGGAIVPGWSSGGLPICTDVASQNSPRLVSDGNGGVFVIWTDQRTVGHSDTYAQHVLATGALANGWPANGRRLVPDVLTPVSVRHFSVDTYPRGGADGTDREEVGWAADVHAGVQAPANRAGVAG